MDLNRRDFLKAASAIAASLALPARMALGATNGPPVVWLQAQSCSGCSVSLLNTIHYMTADALLGTTINLNYHSTLMAAAGELASDTARSAAAGSGYVLIVEGAIPRGAQKTYCYLWPGMTAWDGVQQFARNASRVIAVGSCSAFGGVVKGTPNPSNAGSVSDCIGASRVINIPGCPAHPDWIVGTVATLLSGRLPELDSYRRPKTFFSKKVHERCPFKEDPLKNRCLFSHGCRGKVTCGDCATRQWNANAAGGNGVNWCAGAGTPCHGCTQPDFPDGMSPFFLEDRWH